MTRLLRLLALIALLLCPATADADTTPTPIGATLRVPLDHDRPQDGTAALYYEFGRRFDPRKPTVLLVADGQQYFLRRGVVSQLQQQLFGDGVNVVGLVSRGATPSVIAASKGRDGKVDWRRAWRLFNSRQWIGDLDALRRVLVGREGHVSLYGRSGGAYLVHQYLAWDPRHIDRAFTQSPANPVIARELGIAVDHFWEDLGREDPALQPLLIQTLARFPGDRTAILLTLQRQHFFVTADQLPAARAKLIRTLAAGDTTAFKTLRHDYEVDGVLDLMTSDAAIPQLVRVVELLQPTGAFDAAADGRVSPLIEPQRQFAAPLLKLLADGAITLPPYSTQPASRSAAQVFVLAGRQDEAVDYRVAIALAYSYPRHILFIADDNHTFLRLVQRQLDKPMISAFFAQGPDAPAFRAALAAADAERWRD